MTDIYTAFQDLPRASSEASFSAVPLSAQRLDFLAKSIDGAPVFLIHDASPAHYRPSLTSLNLTVQFHSTCQVETEVDTQENQFAMLVCDPDVPELYELFVRCVGAAVEQLPVNVDTRDIETCVKALLSLFRAMSAIGSREVAGLWGELFVISKSENIASTIDRWHADTFERFDFSWSEGVLEVKATQGMIRAHEFSLEQLQVPIDGQGFVASLLLQQLTNGVGVMDLANTIDKALTSTPSLRQRLWANLTAALGSDFGAKLDRRFDLTYAERNFAFYAMGDVPTLERPSDTRISGIRFRADLSGVVSSFGESSIKALKDALRHSC